MALALVLNRRSQVPAEDSPAFGAIAERFRRAGDLDRAVSLCREGLAKFPEHLSARVTLGWALLDLGRHKEAQAELERVIKRAPDNLAAIRGLAQLHDRMENADASDLQNPSAWQLVEETPEPELDPVVAAAVQPAELAAAPTAALESAEATALDQAANAEDVGPLPFQIRDEAPAGVSVWAVGQADASPAQEVTGAEVDDEVDRLLRAIGPPVAIAAAGQSPVSLQIEEAAEAVAQPEAFVAAEPVPAAAFAPVEAVASIETVASAGPVASTVSAVSVEVAAAEAPISQASSLEVVEPVAPVEAIAPVAFQVEAPATMTAAADVMVSLRDVAQPVATASEPVAVAQFEDVPVHIVTAAEAMAPRPEPVVDEELPPAAAPMSTPAVAVEPVFVLDEGLAPELVLEIEASEVSRPAPEQDFVAVEAAVVELPAPASRAPAVDHHWAPEPEPLLELLPESEPVAPVAEPVFASVDGPLLDLVDPVTMPLTIDIRPEAVTRHDLPTVVLSARRERPAAPAPAVAALEKFLRHVEVRKMRQRMTQSVAS